jgi:hypothetical protein
MSARPETLQVHTEIHEVFSKKFLDPKYLAQFSGDIRDEKTREIVAQSVIQVFSLTPKSFTPKFSELCDCLVKSRMVTQNEAELLKRLGDAYAREDEDQARALLADVEDLASSSEFFGRVQRQTEQTRNQSESDRRRGLWGLIGGLIGAVIGGALGGWSGVGIGWNVGRELAFLLYDDYQASLPPTTEPPTANVRAMPNGDPCTTPIWR